MTKLKPISKTEYKSLRTWEWNGAKACVICDQKNISGDVIPAGSEVVILGKTLKRSYGQVSFNSGFFNIKAKNDILIYGVDYNSLSLLSLQTTPKIINLK